MLEWRPYNYKVRWLFCKSIHSEKDRNGQPSANWGISPVRVVKICESSWPRCKIWMTQCFDVIRYSSVQNVVFQTLVFILGWTHPPRSLHNRTHGFLLENGIISYNSSTFSWDKDLSGMYESASVWNLNGILYGRHWHPQLLQAVFI